MKILSSQTTTFSDLKRQIEDHPQRRIAERKPPLAESRIFLSKRRLKDRRDNCSTLPNGR
ncbi:hypothetical protein DLM78_10655 [Leptospira stimsonii]|uniref:Uncharacterized protein n=1 Tax=Leptospira stimsonii TaxID=2202203 RepID=A0A8B6RYJ1_9LEPT|nr:hypothetical protein DLM78_10655 [Leptospira stimsonii]